MSAELLTLVFSELLSIVKDGSKSLASYIAEVMTKCKLQKTVLHCLIASVYNATRRRHRSDSGTAYFTDAIIDFNESLGIDEGSPGDNDFSDALQVCSLHSVKFLLTKVPIIVSSESPDSAAEAVARRRNPRGRGVRSEASFEFHDGEGIERRRSRVQIVPDKLRPIVTDIQQVSAKYAFVVRSVFFLFSRRIRSISFVFPRRCAHTGPADVPQRRAERPEAAPQQLAAHPLDESGHVVAALHGEVAVDDRLERRQSNLRQS